MECVDWLSVGTPNSVFKQMYDLLEGWLRHKNDMVNYEAARVICEMKGVTQAQLVRPVSGWCHDMFAVGMGNLTLSRQSYSCFFPHQNPP